MMVLAASDMRGAKVNKTKEKHAECEHMQQRTLNPVPTMSIHSHQLGRGLLKRDEKTLMNRHVMTEKQHNTTTISRPTMTKPFNVVNTKPALCFIIWEPPPLLPKQALLLRTKAALVLSGAVDS